MFRSVLKSNSTYIEHVLSIRSFPYTRRFLPLIRVARLCSFPNRDFGIHFYFFQIQLRLRAMFAGLVRTKFFLG